MSTVSIHTLGCKLNFSESSYISKSLEDNDFKIVEFNEYADVYIINTCSVTENADNKFKHFVKQALKINPEAFIAAIGCYAQLKPKELLSVNGVDLVLGAADKFNLLDYLKNIDNDYSNKIHSCNINEVNFFNESYSLNHRTRAFLKVQDGCDYKCSFCTIPLARGKSRSNTISNVVSNVYKIASQDVKEIVLTGINLGDFGKTVNKTNDSNFFDLVKELDKLDLDLRFRISSIEPNLLSDEIIEFISTSKKFVHHFHIPLQSGSDTILKSMRRRYDSKLYESRINKINKLMPDACIGVDVIVGFPGEDDDKFLESLSFLEKLDISYLHVFTYSERDNTHAITLPKIVQSNIRSKRSKLLRILSSRKKADFYKRNIGSTHNVLFESEDKNGFIEGFSPNYIRFRRKWDSSLAGSLVESKFMEIDSQGFAI
ncbi:MAG: tRNA (N(6)-L-threonylcarbamoyladenosine(37)-C(2))-methylthiotransferase MtaB [Cryomorphaceae bacterium]|nr:tRNA (N(6)-L-threonylcarbamoyladenosine(37)-C(2))-methylthiotransferase MtaB [Cryomorphaceae bacterium]